MLYGIKMRGSDNLYKCTGNDVDMGNPPKSIFEIHKEYRTNATEYNNLFPYHYHDWYELYYMIEGRSVYYINSRQYTLESGDWILIPAGIKHKNIYQEKKNFKCMLYFSKDYINPCLYGHISELASGACYIPEAGDKKKLDEIVNLILDEYKKPCKFSSELYKSYLFQLMVLLLLKAQTKSFKGEEEASYFYVQNTIEYINIHFSEKIKLSELADNNFVTAAYLSKCFKKVTGFNISEYIQNQRVLQAKKLLSETNEPIHIVSESCGFNDSNYFSSVFKRYTNMSPVKYRKLNNSNI